MTLRKWVFIFIGILVTAFIVYVGLKNWREFRSASRKIERQSVKYSGLGFLKNKINQIRSGVFSGKKTEGYDLETSTVVKKIDHRIAPLVQSNQPVQPYQSSMKSYSDTQNTLRTIEEINRINRLNQEMQKQSSQNPNKK